MTTADIKYGDGLPTESELRLAGDLGDGKRAIELGVSDFHNAIALARAGAKAIAVDTDAERIDGLRSAAIEAEVNVECHIGDLADLGFATSGSIELVVAHHSLTQVDDLSRTLRQVNRVLRASRPLILTVDHPYLALIDDSPDSTSSANAPYGQTPYGARARSVSDWFLQLSRANFRVDQILELGNQNSRTPTTLVLRARKEGD